MSKSTILFVFEGERTEKQLVQHLSSHFINENSPITYAYCGEIYQLYQNLKKDEDLDTFALLKNRPDNQNSLENYTRDDFAEIYMFFDYDGHSSLADDENLKEMLELFKEETDFGKLYISYPMVECIKHFGENIDFKALTVKAKETIHYKKLVEEEADEGFIHFKRYTFETWKNLIEAHLKKMNFINIDKYQLPEQYFSQAQTFEKQCLKYIIPDKEVAVLSGFPIFLYDYYGKEKLYTKLK